MVLKLSKRNFEKIVRRAKEVFPLEACGILLGKTIGERKIVRRIVSTRNELGSESRYRIDPVEQLGTFELAENRKQDIIGFYHSHPHSSPLFSQIDESEAYYKGYSYLVYSVRDKTAKSYVPMEDHVEEEEIEIK
jgi:proteasome lid subunit RPN8/RPN11